MCSRAGLAFLFLLRALVLVRKNEGWSLDMAKHSGYGIVLGYVWLCPKFRRHSRPFLMLCLGMTNWMDTSKYLDARGCGFSYEL